MTLNQVFPDTTCLSTAAECSCLDGHPPSGRSKIKARDRIFDDPSPTRKRTCGGKDELARPIARRPSFLFGLGGYSPSSARAISDASSSLGLLARVPTGQLSIGPAVGCTGCWNS